jgi:hypothetical protein
MPRDSRLPPDDVTRFYRIWHALLRWTNARKGVSPGAEAPYHPQQALPIRDALWADDGLRHAWIDANPDNMPSADLALVRSWDHRMAGSFIVFKHYAGHTVFLHEGQGYAVLGLTDPLRDMLPVVPHFVEAVLVPYEGRITYDGLIAGFPISFGAGIRRNLADEFRRIQERGELHHSLGPAAEASPADTAAANRKANKSVLASYATYLKAQRHSEAIRARDLAVAEWLAEIAGSDRSLALLCAQDLQDAVASAGRFPVPRSEVFTSLKRFVVFLAESERMGWDEADDVHAWLRARSRGR